MPFFFQDSMQNFPCLYYHTPQKVINSSKSESREKEGLKWSRRPAVGSKDLILKNDTKHMISILHASTGMSAWEGLARMYVTAE